MLGKNRTLFKIFGFPIKVNPTWFLLFFLIVFSLSSRHGLFHRWLGEDEAARWMIWSLGIAGAIGLFASLLIHELAHSIVARQTGMPVKGITLFIFGGVSEMEAEPPTASAEFFMAVVGPLSSLLISAFFVSIWALLRFVLGVSPIWTSLVQYLAIINFALAAFNSLPAFPLDGGRVLRSFLWGITDSLLSATKAAAFVGSAFGAFMIIIGVFSLFYAGGISGIWLMFLGFFLRQAASTSVRNVVVHKNLEGESVGKFMTSPPVCVKQELSIDRFVQEFVLPYHFTVFPVINGDGRLTGIVYSLYPGKINKAHWQNIKVKDIMDKDVEKYKISPDTSALNALSALGSEQGKRLVATQDEIPVGMLSLRDLMDFIQLKADLSE